MGRSTQCPNIYCWQAYEKGVATIRKLRLRMCSKSRRSDTCRVGATAVVFPELSLLANRELTPMSVFTDRPSREQEEDRITLGCCDTKATPMELLYSASVL